MKNTCVMMFPQSQVLQLTRGLPKKVVPRRNRLLPSSKSSRETNSSRKVSQMLYYFSISDSIVLTKKGCGNAWAPYSRAGEMDSDSSCEVFASGWWKFASRYAGGQRIALYAVLDSMYNKGLSEVKLLGG